mgnify:CR=1 FL=1
MKSEKFILGIFLVASIFLLNSFIVSAQSCSDSDGGLNFNQWGSVFGDGNSYDDKCSYGTGGEDMYNNSKNWLFEAYCFQDKDPSAEFGYSYEYYHCPNGCNDGACINSCTDSDGGKNVLEVGQAGMEGTSGQGDWCDYSKGENKIYEAYCVNQTDFALELMDCPTDKPYCNKGECTTIKPQCSEDDGGKNPLVLGTTFPSRIADHTGATDYCQITSTGQPPESGECSGADCSLREFFCVDGSPDEFYNDIPCSSGCKKGVCSKLEPTEENGPIEIIKPEETSQGTTTPIVEEVVCNGCVKDKNCYLIGYRTENQFCDNKQFTNQKQADASCNNNFECSTNLCIDNECVSSGFWQAIMRFFKNLFG